MKKIYILILICFLSLKLYAQGTPCPGTPTVNYAGQTYNTVQIGDQCWLKENLNVGVMMQGDQTKNGVVEKYCYKNDPENCTKWGAFYQWGEAVGYTTSTQKVQGICPSGWHIPTIAEFQILASSVKNDGDALKAPILGEGFGYGSNTSGFTGLLSGTIGYGDHPSHQTVYAYFWSSTAYNSDFSYILSLGFDYKDILMYANRNGAGFSVRCVKGDGTTSVHESGSTTEIPKIFSLSQNYPNPFNPETVISYQLFANCNVSLKVYDVSGKEIVTLVNKFQNAGNYNIPFSLGKTSELSLLSGIYFYTLTTGNYSETRKMILIK